MKAARIGQLNTVELLIKKGADIGVKDKEGKSALSWAIEEKHDHIAQFLRDHGVSEQ
jgi:ankyrin repeat protein